MADFTLTDLGNRSGEVVEAAFSGPVNITSRGKRKFVLLTAARYDELAEGHSQKAHHVSAMDDADRDQFALAMDQIAQQSDPRDG